MNLLKSLILLTVGFAISYVAKSADTLYINSGIYTAVDGNTFPTWSFNSDTTYQANNVQLYKAVGESIDVVLINNDSLVHGIKVQSTAICDTLSPSDTVSFSISFSAEGGYLFYDHIQYPTGIRMGLSGVVFVGNFDHAFFWNIKEHQSVWNDSLIQNTSASLMDYYPDYFLINGNSNPDINQDSVAKVIGDVGDTIRIYIANTGRSIHSLHFHGYHLKIIASSRNSNEIGWNKDTFAVYPMESMILELVPDKPGEYPVHDHNLVAVTGGGMYPSGMFITLLISE